MFGTMGFSELIIILAIILIIFGAGRLPQIGEGLGKALKGFKKEVNEPPPALDPAAPNAPSAAQAPMEQAQTAPQPQPAATQVSQAPAAQSAEGGRTVLAAYQPGPEATPGTTAAMVAAGAGPQPPRPPKPKAQPTAAPAAASGAPAGPTGYQPPNLPTMEDRMAQPPPLARAQYPPLPPSAQPKPTGPAKRPSAVVNKDAVARVQAQQAAMKQQAAQSQGGGLTPKDMQSLGEGLGDTLRTFRQAVADVRSSVDPQMRTIQAELDAAQKEIEQTIETAKQAPPPKEEPPKPS
jgi:TatA/E family protein of Tat protein translocase